MGHPMSLDEMNETTGDLTEASESPAEPQPLDAASSESLAEPQPLDVVSSTTALADVPMDDEEELQQALKNLEKSRAEKKRKKRIKIIVGAAVACGLLAAVLGKALFTPPETEEEYVPETAVVERRDFQNVISSSGALKAGSTVVVTPEVDGIIESVSVTEGQTVKKGDLLFTIKNDTLDKAVRDAAQDVQTANQGVASAQRDVDNAAKSRDEVWNKYYADWNEANAAHKEWAYAVKNYDKDHAAWLKLKEEAEALKTSSIEPIAPTEPAYPDDEEHKEVWDSYRKLYDEYLTNKANWDAYQAALAKLDAAFPTGEPQPAGVEPEYPDKPDDTSLIAAIQSAQDGVTSAAQAVQKAQEAYDEAVKMAEKRKVTAPSGGNIVALGAKVGEAVGGASSGASESGSTGPLVQISDVNQMSVDIEVNEIDILNIHKGQNAKVTFSAVSGVEVNAQVSEVATVATGGGEGGGVVTFHVGLVIPKPDKRLREGMTANVKIFTADVKDALVVPTTALSEGANGYTAEVVLDEETMETEVHVVKVGPRNATEAVIEEGLEEGNVVLLGAGLMDGSEDYGYAG